MIEITDIKKYKPAGHKIVVRYEPVSTKSGLILPQTIKSSKTGWLGTVVAISPGADLKDAGCPDLKIGDIVDTDCIRSACRNFEIGQDIFISINDGDIIATIDK